MPFIDRISSLDPGYQIGNLSNFPEAIDTLDSLYQVRNNAETFLSQGLSYRASFIVVDSTASFPSTGLILIGQEIIYYALKTANTFQNIKRGFAGSRQNPWGKGTLVQGSVMADIHNAAKDSVFNIETDLGTSINPTPASLNGILKSLEARFLAPKPVFRAGPIKGPSPLRVSFQNFSLGGPNRFLWDFGDGSTSVDFAPTHTYAANGQYTVVLNMITSLGGQGIVTKTNYITVDSSFAPAFFYTTPMVGTTSTNFAFVDQTGGNVLRRNWVFDDGNSEIQLDPNIHYTNHTYAQSGDYNPTLLVEFQDGSSVNLVGDTITVN